MGKEKPKLGWWIFFGLIACVAMTGIYITVKVYDLSPDHRCFARSEPDSNRNHPTSELENSADQADESKEERSTLQKVGCVIRGDIFHHTDFFAYLLGIFGIFVGIYIAIAISKSTDERMDKMAEVEAGIERATNELVDATRKPLATLPKIFNELDDILTKAASHPGADTELNVMNQTSAFGWIHTFNPRMVKQFSENEKDICAKDYGNEIVEFEDRVSTSENLLAECFRKIDDVKLLVYNNDLLKTEFITKYFSVEDSPVDIETNKGLKLHKKNNGMEFEDYPPATTADAQYHIDKRATIATFVEHQHDQFTRRLFNAREVEGRDIGVIRNTADPIQIPKMVIFLAKYKEDNELVHRSLVIFTVNEQKKDDKQRVLLGIGSTSERIYNVFETFFNDFEKKGTPFTP
jgi:hypothetical protein